MFQKPFNGFVQYMMLHKIHHDLLSQHNLKTSKLTKNISKFKNAFENAETKTNPSINQKPSNVQKSNNKTIHFFKTNLLTPQIILYKLC